LKTKLLWNRECGEFMMLLGYSLRTQDARAKRGVANATVSER
jgi:hypothetical protein